MATSREHMARRLSRVARAHRDEERSRSCFPPWLGQLISNVGNTLHYIALVALAFKLADLVAAEIIPIWAFAPVAGIIDRFSRKTVLFVADIHCAVLTLSLVWSPSASHAYLVGGAFFNPVVQAIIPAVTKE